MGTIKDRHGKDLIETEEIQERWKEYRELYKKDLNDPDNHHGVVTHPEPDILKCEVERVLWSTAVNKASEGNGIPAELFKILKDGMLSKRCTQYESKFGKYSSGHCTDKGQSSSHFPRTKECSIALISQASKVTLKIMHMLSLSITWMESFQMFKLGLEKTEETRYPIANICWIIDKAREFQKNIYLFFIDC